MSQLLSQICMSWKVELRLDFLLFQVVLSALLLFMLQELIDMVHFFSFSFIENSPNDEVDNRKLDNELEIEDPVEGKPTC